MADVELQINVPAMKQAMAISRQQVFSKGAYIYTVVLPESLEVMLMNHMLSQSDGWVHMESFKGKLCMYLDEIRVRLHQSSHQAGLCWCWVDQRKR